MNHEVPPSHNQTRTVSTASTPSQTIVPSAAIATRAKDKYGEGRVLHFHYRVSDGQSVMRRPYTLMPLIRRSSKVAMDMSGMRSVTHQHDNVPGT
jgi:hypothetical protein